MIIHLNNQYEAQTIPFDVLTKAYLVTFEYSENMIGVVKWRNAPERLLRILKIGVTSYISREDYYELRDFIVDTYYIQPLKVLNLAEEVKESMDDYTKKLEMKIWHETYCLYVSKDGISSIPIAKVFENCDRAVREFRKSMGISGFIKLNEKLIREAEQDLRNVSVDEVDEITNAIESDVFYQLCSLFPNWESDLKMRYPNVKRDK